LGIAGVGAAAFALSDDPDAVAAWDPIPPAEERIQPGPAPILAGAESDAAAPAAAPQAAPPTPLRFAHGEYFEAGLGDWRYPPGYQEVRNSVLRLQAYYADSMALGVAPWPMTAGRLRGRVLAETMPALPVPNLPINAYLIFDHGDDWNYKFAGLQVSSGRWVIGVVNGGAETILASATATLPQADRWYTLDLGVGLNQVTLYAGGAEPGHAVCGRG
jgi:hypothetical protein